MAKAEKGRVCTNVVSTKKVETAAYNLLFCLGKTEFEAWGSWRWRVRGEETGDKPIRGGGWGWRWK